MVISRGCWRPCRPSATRNVVAGRRIQLRYVHDPLPGACVTLPGTKKKPRRRRAGLRRMSSRDLLLGRVARSSIAYWDVKPTCQEKAPRGSGASGYVGRHRRTAKCRSDAIAGFQPRLRPIAVRPCRGSLLCFRVCRGGLPPPVAHCMHDLRCLVGSTRHPSGIRPGSR
jgi:hypothetical protein